MTMIVKQFSILDTAAQAFLNHIAFKSEAEAIRWFTTMVNGDETESNIARYPHQFILYRLHDWDSQTGMFLSTMDGKDIRTPKELVIGTSVKEPQNLKYTIQDLAVMLNEYQEKFKGTNSLEVQKLKEIK